MRGIATLAIVLLLPAPGGARPQNDAPPPEPILGTPADITAEPATTVARLSRGSRLHRDPDAGSPVVAVVDEAIEVPVLARRGGWVEVRYRSWRGWVAAGAEEARGGAGGPPPAGERRVILIEREAETPPEAPPPMEDAAAARIERARELLGAARTERSFGFGRLLTDVEDPQLLPALVDTAESVPAAYQERFGLDIPPGAEATVVVFARQEAYRAYAAAEAPVAGLGLDGFAVDELVVFAAGEKSVEELRELLVHELVHVLQHGGFVRPTQAWLEEGMANELGFSRFAKSGAPVLGTVRGDRRVESHADRLRGRVSFERAVTIEGPLGALSRLVSKRAGGTWIPLAELLDLPEDAFLEPAGRELRYAESAFLVRYLLDGEGGRFRAPFRAFVAAAAAGGAADARALRAVLGLSQGEIERRYLEYLESSARRLALR